MKNLNLVNILKDVPKNTELYSPMFGKVFLISVEDQNPYPVKVKLTGMEITRFTKEGYWADGFQGECVLFPSRENRDWSTFKVKNDTLKTGDYVRAVNHGLICKITSVCINEDSYIGNPVTIGNEGMIPISGGKDCFEKVEHFDLETLRPFDKVLIKDDVWEIDLFGRLDKAGYINTMNRIGFPGSDIVPYNNDTKYLVGTDLDAPKFYKM